MKKIILNILLLNIVAILLFSCKKDGTLVTASTDATPAVLAASSTTLVLTKATLADTAETFTITAPNFGFASGTTNTIEFAVKGTSFASVKSSTLAITSAESFTKKYTVKELNDIMLSLNLPTGITSDVEVRIVSKISEKVTSVKSNIISLKVTPFALVSFIYAPGAYQGWNFTSVDSLISPSGNGIYNGVIDFTEVTAYNNCEFIITPQKDWAPKYVSGGVGLLLKVTGGLTDNLKAPTNHSYLISANLNTNTISYQKQSYGIIGDATPTGWDSDTNMKYNNGTQEWSVTIALIGGNNIKFRLNDAWDVNYGGANGVLTTTSNNNILVPSNGTYKVTFSIAKATYSLVKQ